MQYAKAGVILRERLRFIGEKKNKTATRLIFVVCALRQSRYKKRRRHMHRCTETLPSALAPPHCCALSLIFILLVGRLRCSSTHK